MAAKSSTAELPWKHLYKTTEINGLSGTMVPPALTRRHLDADGKWVEGLQNHSGAAFQVTDHLPQTAVVTNPDGTSTTTAISVEAVKLLQQRNRVGSKEPPLLGPDAYLEAERIVRARREAVSAAQPSVVEFHAPAAASSNPSPPEGVLEALPAAVVSGRRPQLTVELTGPFGTMRLACAQVFRDGMCLVLVQDTGFSYRPPSGMVDRLQLSCLGKTYWCFVGVHYTLPGTEVTHSVYLIDEDATP